MRTAVLSARPDVAEAGRGQERGVQPGRHEAGRRDRRGSTRFTCSRSGALLEISAVVLGRSHGYVPLGRGIRASDLLASGGEDGHPRIWDVSDLEGPGQVEDESVGGAVPGLAYSPTSRLLAAAAAKPHLWKVAESGQLEPGPRLPRRNGGRPCRPSRSRQAGDHSQLHRLRALPLVRPERKAEEARGARDPFSAVAFADERPWSRAAGTTTSRSGTWPAARRFGPPRAHAAIVEHCGRPERADRIRR